MKRSLAITLSAAALLGAASFANAQETAAAPAADVVDMSSMSCQVLLAMDQTKVGFAIIWGMGYVDGGTSKTSLDLNSLQTVAMGVGMICGSEPATMVLEAVKRAGTPQ